MSSKSNRSSKELVEAARAYLSEANFSPVKAGELLTIAVQQDPTFVNALVLRSNLASRLGQLTSAIADLSLAIEVDRGSSDVRRMASLYGSRSNLFARAGRHADAIADLHSALKCEPDNGMWTFELGRAYLREGRVSLAQLNFQQTLQEPMWSHVNESTRAKVYALYGRSCLMSRDYKKAKALLQKSLEVGGEGARVLHDVGLAHYHEGTSRMSAIDFFARATETDPQTVEYPMHLGLAHTRCGKLHDALSSMNEAVLRGQDDALLRFYRGCIELQLGLGPQALVDLQAAAEAQSREVDEGVSAKAKKRADTLGKEMTSSAPAWIAMALVHLFCEHSLSVASMCLAQALQRDMDQQQRTLAGVLLGIVRHQEGELFAALHAFSDVVATVKTIKSAAKDANESALSSSSFDRSFFSDMELLMLTHLGLVYSSCGYADLALRFFTQARQRAQQRGDAAQLASCLFREAVAQIDLRDNWGALQTVQSSTATADGASADRDGQPGPASTSATFTGTDLSSATLASFSAAAATTKAQKKLQASALNMHAELTSSFVTLHQQAPGETAHLYAVTLRRLGRLSEALPFATAAVEGQLSAAAMTAATPFSGGDRSTHTTVKDVPAYLYNRALIHFLLGNYTEAMRDVQACIQACAMLPESTGVAASADPYYLQGCIAHAVGNFVDALSSLTTALTVDATLRGSPVFSYSHGVLLAIAGKHEEAIDAFTAAIVHSSSAEEETTHCPVVYHHERAKVYQQLGRYAEALADYNCVLPKAHPGAPEKESDVQPSNMNWNALVNRALTLKELHRYDEAATDWRTALRLDTSGCLAQFTSHDVFEMPYMELCLPGCEIYDTPTM